MATNLYDEYQDQSVKNYLHKRHIHELFEAMTTALMVYKPDDHISFLRKCLDKVDNTRTAITWDFFVTKSVLNHDHQKSLPPVYSSSHNIPSFDPQISHKSSVLPPIEHVKTHLPIIFILSLTNSLKLCSKLLERYHDVEYLLINDMANIDNSEPTDLQQHDYRYDCIQRSIERRRKQAKGFLIIGELEEQNYLKQWQEKLDRIDLIIILSEKTDRKDFNIIHIDPTHHFNDIVSSAIQSLDRFFPQDAFLSHRSETMLIESVHLNLPILFCIDNHRLRTRENHNEHILFDEEFDMIHEDTEEENNNSFIYTLCQRLSEQLKFKHIHYGDFHKKLLNFEELKSEIIESMSTCSGFIIDHFPTSFHDLQNFQSEIGPCSILIYIGDHPEVTDDDEVNTIIKTFTENRKALYVDCRKEVDEIYEDLKSEILKHI
ncbi:hypothetical protein I4U23_000454 [Adineta vaga]|nr:hypothetical protein I4U23_000454 [Adineta vaga]